MAIYIMKIIILEVYLDYSDNAIKMIYVYKIVRHIEDIFDKYNISEKD